MGGGLITALERHRIRTCHVEGIVDGSRLKPCLRVVDELCADSTEKGLLVGCLGLLLVHGL